MSNCPKCRGQIISGMCGCTEDALRDGVLAAMEDGVDLYREPDPSEEARWDASVEQIHRELAGEIPPPSVEEETVSGMLMDAIEEHYHVENWRNPEKGITRIEACLAFLRARPSEDVEGLLYDAFEAGWFDNHGDLSTAWAARSPELLAALRARSQQGAP